MTTTNHVSRLHHYRSRIYWNSGSAHILRPSHFGLLQLALHLLLLRSSLQSANLARLNTVDLLATNVDASTSISESVSVDVLLLERLELARLATGQFVQVVGGDLGATDRQIHGRSDLGQLNARRLKTTLLEQDFVGSEQDLVVVGGCEAEHMLDSLQPNGVHRVPMECVDEQRLEASVFFGLRPFWAVEDETWLDTGSDFVVLEVSQSAILLDAQFDHVKQLILEYATQDQVVRSLLRRRTKQKQRAVVLFSQTRIKSFWKFNLQVAA